MKRSKKISQHIITSLFLLSTSCSLDSTFEKIGGSKSTGGNGPSVETTEVNASKITKFIFQKNIPLSANFFQNMNSVDTDGDGDLDLILTETNSSKISFLKNDGTGDFKLDKSLATSGKVYSRILTDDLNNDGHYDIAVVSYGGVVNLWLNDGSNHFTSRIDIPTTVGGKAVNFISSGDLNNDGFTDLAIANTADNNTGKVSILLNSGTVPLLSFTQVDLATGLAPYGVVLSDLNQDGLDDLAFTSRTDGLVHIYENVAGVLTPATHVAGSIDPSGSLLTDIVSADFNNDGIMDLAWGSECTLGKLECHKSVYDQHIYVGYGSHNLSLSLPVVTYKTNAYGDVRMLDVYDVNNDGHLDLISIDDINFFPFSTAGEFASLSILINDKDQGFLEVQNKMLKQEQDSSGNTTAPGSSYSNSFAFGDFNNDGLTDFIADAKLNSSNQSSGVRVYFGQIR